MKKVQIWMLVSALIACCQSNPLRAQALEVTDQFKQLVKEIVREEFKSFLYNKLKDDDPIIAASAYDLIDRIVSGDSIAGIGKQVMISTMDYSLFLELRNQFEEFVPYGSVRNEDSSAVGREEYMRMTKVGALLAYELIARENYLVVGSGLRKMLAEETKMVSSHYVDTTGGREKFGMAAYKFTRKKERDIRLLLNSISVMKDIIICVAFADTNVILALKAEYETVVERKFDNINDFLRHGLGMLKSRMDLIVTAYESMRGNKYATIYRDIVPYVYNNVVERINKVPINYNAETVKMLVTELSSLSSEDKTGFKYRIGLWAGVFAAGKSWSPPASSDVVVSLRLNDRIEYTWEGGPNHDLFVYVGGFVDAALKEISKQTDHQFLFGGIGYSYKSISVTASGYVPINGNGGKGGSVFAIMYDLPIEKVIGVL